VGIKELGFKAKQSKAKQSKAAQHLKNQLQLSDQYEQLK
jgi:hypothetical protein